MYRKTREAFILFLFYINGRKQSDVFVYGKYGQSDLESFIENKIFYILSLFGISS